MYKFSTPANMRAMTILIMALFPLLESKGNTPADLSELKDKYAQTVAKLDAEMSASNERIHSQYLQHLDKKIKD